MLLGLFVWVVLVASIELFFIGVTVGYFQKKFILIDTFGFLIASLVVTLFLYLGSLVGKMSVNLMPNYTTWYAATILFILGLKLFYDGIKLHKTKQLINPLDIKGLLVLSILVGLNGFFVGLVFGLLQINNTPVYLSFLLFLSAILAGYFIGFRVKKLPSFRYEFIAGIVFISIAVIITQYF